MKSINNNTKYIFQKNILKWYDQNKRSFPWRNSPSPYEILISEVLLQQTNAEKVVQPYKELVSTYPTFDVLADADITILRQVFKPLGLFYRADKLIEISNKVKSEHGGSLPNDEESLLGIKGIGKYTANAVLCFGFNQKVPIIDTNIIRIFYRFFGIKSEKKRAITDKTIWSFAESLLPDENYVGFNYGMLDFAALVCKHYHPLCDKCVISTKCWFFNNSEDTEKV